MATNDLDGAIERSHVAAAEIVRGNPEAFHALFSRRDDVTLGNPLGPFARGRNEVAETLADAATLYEDGEVSSPPT